MTRVRRSRTHGSAKAIGKDLKTRRYQKDVDQVAEELKRVQAGLTRLPKTASTVQEAEADELPGCGEYPCIECSRHFISDEALQGHRKTKIHRRRMKQLKDEPYSQAEAEAAAGLKTDNRRRDATGELAQPASTTAKDQEMA